MESNIKLNEAFNFVSALNYNPEKVEYRVVMKNRHGEAVMVALTAGSHLATHEAPEDVIITVMEGEADFDISGQIQRLTAGNGLLMQKGTAHSVKALRDTKILLIKIKP